MKIEKIITELKRHIDTRDYRSDPFLVLISTILSQRTRDEKTHIAASRLFSRYKTPAKVAGAPVEEIQELIKEVGFYRVKAGRIKNISRIIEERYGGRVPEDIEELLSLPGVGRKTANCVMLFGFGKSAVPVDTHVHRISNRLGIVNTKTPERTEQELMKNVSKKRWRDLNSLFVGFGQSICRPVNPKCCECPVAVYCCLRK
ncbi:MAG: endonuclease III domain-containing protein [Candidatus Hydrothermarchaeaceae archaeon]